MIYSLQKHQKGNSQKNMRGDARIVIVIASFFIVIVACCMPIIIVASVFGYAKDLLDGPCNGSWIKGFEFWLAGSKEEDFNRICGGGSSGGAGASGDYDVGGICGYAALKRQLMNDEGLRLWAYDDGDGNITIGYGHNLTSGDKNVFKTKTGKDVDSFLNNYCPTGNEIKCTGNKPEITKDEALILFNSDTDAYIRGAESVAKSKGVVLSEQPDEARKIIIEMAFQAGTGGLGEYKNMFAAIKDKNWVLAAAEIMDSKTYDTLNCDKKAPGKTRSQIQALKNNITTFKADVIDKIDPISSCRTSRQAKKMAALADDPSPTTTVEKCGDIKGLEVLNGATICAAETADTSTLTTSTLNQMLGLVTINPGKKDIDVATDGQQIYQINGSVFEMLKTASKTCDKCFKISSAYRSCAKQKTTCQNICHQDSCSNTNPPCAAPGKSNHQKGIAVDITGNNGHSCSKGSCDDTIIKALESAGLKQFLKCAEDDGSSETGTDCYHFSPNGT